MNDEDDQVLRHFSKWKLVDYSKDELDIRFEDLRGQIKDYIFLRLGQDLVVTAWL